jgi:hypothetical protein
MDVAADPKALKAYSKWAENPHLTLLTQTNLVAHDFQVLVRSSPDRIALFAPPTDAVLKLLEAAIALDRWAGDVGLWFEQADQKALTMPLADFQALIRRVWGPMAPTIGGVTTYPGWNPLYATHGGPMDAAGYPGGACAQGNVNFTTSIVGPDGKTYPVVVPGPQKGQIMTPGPVLPGSPSGVPDDGRIWHNTGISVSSVSENPGWADKVVTAIAYSAGYRPTNGAAVDGQTTHDVLEVSADGYPTLKKGTGAALPSNPSLPSPVHQSREGNAKEGGANGIDIVNQGIAGWQAAANDGTGMIQTVFQEDGQGHRRVVVRGYQVRKDEDGTYTVYVGYWDGSKWILLKNKQ